MDAKSANLSALQAITLAPQETISFQGAPDTKLGLWHCFEVLLNVTLVMFVAAAGLAYFHVTLNMIGIAFGAYLIILFLLSMIDAYTDRNVYYCLTNIRIMKLKGGRIEKQLNYDEIANVTHKEKDGQGFFLFSGGPDGMTVISLMGISHVSAVYAALPPEVKRIADASNQALIQ